MSELKASYFKLKNRLNRVPYLNDFQVLDGVDPLLIIGKEKHTIISWRELGNRS